MKKRITLNRLGKPVIEVKNADGVFERVSEADALAKLKAADLTLASGITRSSGINRKVGRNPYDGTSVPDSKKLRKRSGLDYLRTLSTEIKKRRDGDE